MFSYGKMQTHAQPALRDHSPSSFPYMSSLKTRCLLPLPPSPTLHRTTLSYQSGWKAHVPSPHVSSLPRITRLDDCVTLLFLTPNK